MANSNKDKKVSVSILSVDQNVIYYGNTAISINNVSMVSISPVPANNSWIIAAVMALIGLVVFQETGMADLIIIAAISF